MHWEESACLLCDIVNREQWVPFRGLFPDRADSEILLETPSFVVIPDIGPIVEGYCLIVSKEHVSAMAFLPDEKQQELLVVKNVIREALLVSYGKSIVFEHGEVTFARNAGACIDHAHMHIVPTSIDFLTRPTDIQFEEILHPSRLKDYVSNRGYLYYENQSGRAFLSLVDHCAQQYFRRKLSTCLGNGVDWNWRDYIRFADSLGTKARIQNMIEKLSGLLKEVWIASVYPKMGR